MLPRLARAGRAAGDGKINVASCPDQATSLSPYLSGLGRRSWSRAVWHHYVGSKHLRNFSSVYFCMYSLTTALTIKDIQKRYIHRDQETPRAHRIVLLNRVIK